MANDESTAESSAITSRPPEVLIGAPGAPAPARVYIQQHDRGMLRVHNSLASVAVVLRFEILRPDGHIQPHEVTLVPTSDRASSTRFFSLSEGFLMRAVAFDSAGLARRGECFVQFGIMRGREAVGNEVELVLSDYIARGWALSYPGSKLMPSFAGRGIIRTIAGTDPAAGVEITETVPTNAIWRFMAFLVTLVTDATVITRTVFIGFTDGTNAYTSRGFPTGIPASTTSILGLATTGDGSSLAATSQNLTAPQELYIPAGHQILTSTTNLQAGDNFGQPFCHVEEWLQD